MPGMHQPGHKVEMPEKRFPKRVSLLKASFIQVPLEKCSKEEAEEPVIFLMANDSYLQNAAREHHTLNSLRH